MSLRRGLRALHFGIAVIRIVVMLGCWLRASRFDMAVMLERGLRTLYLSFAVMLGRGLRASRFDTAVTLRHGLRALHLGITVKLERGLRVLL